MSAPLDPPEPSGEPVLMPTGSGLHCPAGGFSIDPMRPVERAVITHGHADHARGGHGTYWCLDSCEPILRHRLGQDLDLRPVPAGEVFRLGEAKVSLHPAGHVLGSAQVRVEVDGAVWVVTGDFKRDADPTCPPFEPVPCDVLITEATFALPTYRWPDPVAEVGRIRDWWVECAQTGRTAILLVYALGKAQRILAELWHAADRSPAGLPGPIHLHGALPTMVQVYRDAGVALPPCSPVTEQPKGHDFTGSLVLAPPSARGTPWLKRFGDVSLGFASGWMRVRGSRRRRNVDQGFVISDHADWPALLQTVADCRPKRVLTTHGESDTLARFLRECRGVDAVPLSAADPMVRTEGDDG